VWNYFLNRRKEEYLDNKKTLNYYDCANELTKVKKKTEYNWLKEVNSQTLQHTLRDLDTAYNKFFRKKPSSQYSSQSTKSKVSGVPQHISVKNDKIYFPKFKEGIKLNIHREFGEIRFITISKTSTNKYFVSLNYAKLSKRN
jgi:putative transposase